MVSNVAEEVLKSRYYREKEKSWGDVCRRVADFIGETQEEKDKYYEMMYQMDFLPNSPTLMNAGTEIGQLSACFVLPVEDSIDGIFDAVKWAAKVHKSGGGTGFNFSNLRAENSKVGSTGGIASGPISFMKVFDAATEQIKQGSKRRGANMGMLNIDHPDALKFIRCKNKEGDITNFNISVMVTDKFMEKPDKEKLDAIVDGVYRNGEPGVVFYDTINKSNPTPQLGAINSTNPCGEQPLLDHESCNLGSINLGNFVLKESTVDWDRLKDVVKTSVRFLDEIIDKNKYPIPEISKATKKTRKVGLGVMGWHDMLLEMGIPYDSENAFNLAEQLMKNINLWAYEESQKLATEKGNFPEWKDSIYGQKNFPIRNAARTTIAPTGSISLIANASSGIEPVFSWVHKRKNTVGKEFFIVHPLFAKELKKLIPDRYDYVIQHAYENGTIQDLDFLPKEFRNLYKSALDIGYKDHIRMQATFQRHTDNAISKTINMPSTATKEDIKDALFMAWKLGCKGITIYRQGSRDKEVLTLKEKKPEPPKKLRRPKELQGITYKMRSGCGKLYVTVNEKDGKPYEIFIAAEGGCTAFSDALARTLSLSLRFGAPVRDIIRQLSRVRCQTAMKNPQSDGKSCAAIIAQCINLSIPDEDEEVVITTGSAPKEPELEVENNAICPSCGSKLEFGEGCNRGICKVCAWSGCA